MKLTLDYTMRLNLHALLGAQRAALDDLRTFWRLQDLIDLTEEEKSAINYRTVQQNGQALVQWDAGKILPTREIELQEVEFQKIQKVFHDWQPGFLIGADRAWIEPLMAQLDATPASAKVNGPAAGAGLGAALPRN